MKAVVVMMGLVLAGLGMAAAPASAGDLKIGDQAPNFKLQATDGKTYQLSDFKGKATVVLAWFPKAFTQGCTIECKSLAEHGDMIKKYNAQYFMISVDPLDGEKGNKAFAESEHADFPLLSDPTKAIATDYGVLNTERGFANRWTFYIGKDGKITGIDKTVKPATSAEDMAAMLKQLGTEARKK
jgi:thioredoxin-dependent peroxiredoxin